MDTPSSTFTPIYRRFTSYNINGGGAGVVYNATPLFGINAEFMDYTGGGGAQLKAHGYNGNVSGNLFTYLFGPQIKKHLGRFQPFGEVLSGAGRSGADGSIYSSIHGILSAGDSNNSFAIGIGWWAGHSTNTAYINSPG